MNRSWSGSTTIATGQRLCEVKFAAGHHAAALSLLRDICSNLHHVYGALHSLTVTCETLRSRFLNTCGKHAEARDIHVHLLEEIVRSASSTKTTAVAEGEEEKDGMREDLVGLSIDQAKRLKWTCRQGSSREDLSEEDGFYATLLGNAREAVGYAPSASFSSSFSSPYGGVAEELREAMDVSGGPVQETIWEMPEDWSLPIEGEM